VIGANGGGEERERRGSALAAESNIAFKFSATGCGGEGSECGDCGRRIGLSRSEAGFLWLTSTGLSATGLSDSDAIRWWSTQAVRIAFTGSWRVVGLPGFRERLVNQAVALLKAYLLSRFCNGLRTAT
jgi:hypothetical protein